jgi:WD40 repeat protein
MSGFPNSVAGVAFCKNGRHAISMGHNGIIRLWDTNSGTLLREFRSAGTTVTAPSVASPTLGKADACEHTEEELSALLRESADKRECADKNSDKWAVRSDKGDVVLKSGDLTGSLDVSVGGKPFVGLASPGRAVVAMMPKEESAGFFMLLDDGELRSWEQTGATVLRPSVRIARDSEKEEISECTLHEPWIVTGEIVHKEFGEQKAPGDVCVWDSNSMQARSFLTGDVRRATEVDGL